MLFATQAKARLFVVFPSLLFIFRVCCSQRHRHTPQNGRFNITAEAHLQVLSDLGVTQIQLDALAEAKGGISRDR